MNEKINYERIINDLGIKIANLVVENAFKEAQLQDALAELNALKQAQSPAIDASQDMELIHE